MNSLSVKSMVQMDRVLSDSNSIRFFDRVLMVDSDPIY